MHRSKNIELQILLSIFFIFTTIISIILLYNEDLYIKYKQFILNPKNAYIIASINRIVILIILLLFLYANYVDKNIDILENKDLKADNLQIIASILSIISGIIVLYVTIEYFSTNINSSLENPVN
ncbi:MAG: hypothetical protein MR411_03670 [Tenericutes bacterium]|nr:hypothetical protein [Mycoplasmatota bacterium]